MKVLSTILIGRNQGGPGVVSRIIHVVDGSRRTKAPLLDMRTVLLEQSIVPKSPNEFVFMLTAIPGDVHSQSFTWIGCYQAAIFPNNPRGGVYVGVGLLVEGSGIAITAAIDYVLAVLIKILSLADADGVIHQSIFDLDPEQFVSRHARKLEEAGPDVKFHLHAHSFQRLLISIPEENALNHINDSFVKISKSLNILELGSVVVTNSRAIAERADQSRLFSTITAEKLFRQSAQDTRSLIGSANTQTWSGRKVVDDERIAQPIKTSETVASQSAQPSTVAGSLAPSNANDEPQSLETVLQKILIEVREINLGLRRSDAPALSRPKDKPEQRGNVEKAKSRFGIFSNLDGQSIVLCIVVVVFAFVLGMVCGLKGGSFFRSGIEPAKAAAAHYDKEH